jgi:hypothetical protein
VRQSAEENPIVATASPGYEQSMTAHANFKEIQHQAFALPEAERATLAAGLLASLPPVLVEDDDGVAEAMCRSRELDADPSLGCSWDEIKLALGR